MLQNEKTCQVKENLTGWVALVEGNIDHRHSAWADYLAPLELGRKVKGKR